MSSSKSVILYRLLRLSLLLTLAVIVLFLLLHLSQLRFWGIVCRSIFCPEPGQPELRGQPLARRTAGDVLLVVDNGQIAGSSGSQRFETVNWSYAWSNFLEQECGGSCALIDWRQLPRETCADRRLIIITSSAARNIPSIAVLAKLRRAAENGGCVLLETPQASWRSLSGGVLEDDTFNAGAGTSRGQVLAYENLPNRPRGRVLQAERLLAGSPVFSFIHATRELNAGTKGQGLIRDVPAMWERPCGQGWIVTLTFDFGMHLQAMQQGAPSQGWTVRELNGALPVMVESQDLAISRDMMDNDYPYADMLEDWLAGYLDGALRLWPRWWRFPYAYDGVLALTCNETGLEKDGMPLPDLPSAEDAGTFTLFSAVPDRRGAENGAGPVSRGILWKRFAPHIPLRRQLELAGLAERPGRFCRIYNLEWGGGYTVPFRNMASAGIELDSSYGPNRFRGYMFGTGLPFQALDNNGLPLGVWEWPFVLRGGMSAENVLYAEELLKDSLAAYHQAPAAIWQPVSGDDGFRLYYGRLSGSARQRRHWLTDFNDYWNFHQNRRRAFLQSRMRNGRLEASLHAPAPDMAVLLHGSARNIKINDRPALVRSLRFNGEHHWLAAVPEGSSRLTAESGWR